MLDGRVYRTAFIPALVALCVAAFALEDRPPPARSTLSADAFSGERALGNPDAPVRTSLLGIAAAFPDRRAGGARTDTAAAVRWEVAPVLEEGDRGLSFGGPTTTRLDSDDPGDPDDMGGLAWLVDVDVSVLRPGDYVFTAYVRATGQASDSPARFTDTRTFTIP